MAKRASRQRRHLGQLARATARQRMCFEQLELRSLLAITGTLTGPLASFVGDANADQLWLRANGGQELEFSFDGVNFTNDADTVAFGVQPLSLVAFGVQISVDMFGGDDQLTIDTSLVSYLNTVPLSFDGGADRDTLRASQPDTHLWSLAGDGVGTVDVGASFVHVEHLVGGALLDKFLFAPAFNYTGTIEGQDGLLRIEGTNDVTLTGGAVVSSRQITGNSPLTDPSLGNSGNIEVVARTITIDGFSLVTARSDAGFTPGMVTIEATDGVTNQSIALTSAEVDITDAVVTGGDVRITALNQTDAQAEQLQFTLGAEIATVSADAQARVWIDGQSRIESTGDVAISATSELTNSAKGYAQASGSTNADAVLAQSALRNQAIARLLGQAIIDASGDVSIVATSRSDSETLADGATSGTGAAGGSVAVTELLTTTTARIDGLASVTNASSLTVLANAEDIVATQATSTSQGATQNDAGTQTLLASQEATTPEGAVDVGSAIAVNVLVRNVSAVIASQSPINVLGWVNVSSNTRSNFVSAGNASSTNNAQAEAVGVAINRVTSTTEAIVGGSGGITSGDVTVHAIVSPAVANEDLFAAQAISGQGKGGELAGSLALNAIVDSSDARLAETSNLHLTSGSLAIVAEHFGNASARAEAKTELSSQKTLGTGASVALQMVETPTNAVIEPNTAMAGVLDVMIRSASVQAAITEAIAGATAGKARAPVFAATYRRAHTTAQIDPSATPLTAAGDLEILATHEGTTETYAQGSATAAERAVNASMAANIADDAVVARTIRNLIVGDALHIVARNAAASAAHATANATGTLIADSNSAKSSDKVKDQAESAKLSVNQLATSQGGTLTTANVPDPETPEQSIVEFAAAMALNLPVFEVMATIAPDLTIVAGGAVQVLALSNADTSANADASTVSQKTTPTGTGTGIGAGDVNQDQNLPAQAAIPNPNDPPVDATPEKGIAIAIALNVGVSLVTTAFVGERTLVDARDLRVKTEMLSGGDLGQDVVHEYESIAISGLGTTADGSRGFAGALAVNLIRHPSEALIKEDASIVLQGGNLDVVALHASQSTSQALPREQGVTTIKKGTGASFAVNIVENVTLAQINDGGSVSGAASASIVSASNHEMTTLAEAGVASGKARAPVLGVSYHRNETTSRIAPGSLIAVTGDLFVGAEHVGSTKTDARGSSEATERAVSAAFALTFGQDVVLARVDRDLSAGGDISIEARNRAFSDASSTAIATGTVIVEDPSATKKSEKLKAQAIGVQSYVDQKALGQGHDATNATIPDAETPEKQIVEFAAAFSLNLPTATTEASIAPDLSIVAVGGVSVVALSNDDASANADASTVLESTSPAGGGSGSDIDNPVDNDNNPTERTLIAVATESTLATGIAIAVALNIGDELTTAAYIGESTHVSAIGVDVVAGMAPVPQPKGPAEERHSYSAKAVSGVGTTHVNSRGFAGSLAVNLIVHPTRALIESDVVVTLDGGDLLVDATSNSTSRAKALPKNEGVTVGKKGLGASFAVDVVHNTTLAEIQLNAGVTGGQHATVMAHSDHDMETLAEAGVHAGRAKAPVLAVSFHRNRTEALVQPGATIWGAGDFRMHAEHVGYTDTSANGSVEASERGLNASFALTLADDLVRSHLDRDVVMAGEASITAWNGATSYADATATAQGTRTQNSSNPDLDSDEVAKQADDVQSFASSLATGKGGAASDGETPEPKTPDGAVLFAGAFAVNVAQFESRATIADGRSVGVIGALVIESLANFDASALADGQVANDHEVVRTGIAAAVAINHVTAVNTAHVGSNADLTAQSVLVHADVWDMPLDEVRTDTQHEFAAHAISGAGANSVGVAGSFALNIVKNDTISDLGTSVSATFSGRGLSIDAGNMTTSSAVADSTALGGETGVGVSAALNLVRHQSLAHVEDGVQLVNPLTVVIFADSRHDLETKGSAGTVGGTGATPAFALTNTDHHVEAILSPGAVTGTPANVAIRAIHTGNVSTNATGESAGENVAIGATVAITVAREYVLARLDRSIEADLIVVESTNDASTFTNSRATARGGQEKSSSTPDDAVDQENQDRLDFLDDMANANDLDEPQETTPSANTSEGTVSVAAALALNLATTRTEAYVGPNWTIRASQTMRVIAQGNVDSAAHADGQAVDGEGTTTLGVGVAVAINRSFVTTEAVVSSFTSIETPTLSVVATMWTVPSHRPDDVHRFAATAVSGAGSDKIGLAGALALNLSYLVTQAHILADATIINAAVTVESQNNSLHLAEAQAEVQSGDGKVGIGPSVALNFLTNTVSSSIDDRVQLWGVGNTRISTDSTANSTTFAAGGAAGGVAIDASVAITTISELLHASLDQGPSANILGSLRIESHNHGQHTVTADGKDVGAKVGIGASLALVDSDSSTVAYLRRDVSTGSTLDVVANADRSYRNRAAASVAGAKAKQDISKPSQAVASTKALEDGDAKTPDGKLEAAAAVAMNLLDDHVRAIVWPSLTISTTGTMTVAASNQSNFTADANADATKGNVGIGVAVALNVLQNETEAYIDQATQIVSSGDLGLSAMLFQNASPTFATLLAANAISGAGADKVGIAGAAAINRSEAKTEAYVARLATIQTIGGLDVRAEVISKLSSTALGTTQSEGSLGLGASVAWNDSDHVIRAEIGDQTNITARSVSVQAWNHRVGSLPFSFTQFNTLNLANLLAHNNYYALAVAGGFGSNTTIEGAFAVNHFDDMISARVGQSAHLEVIGRLSVEASNDTRTKTLAGSVAGGDKVGIGLSSTITLNNTVTEASIARNAFVRAGNDVFVGSDVDQEIIQLGVSGSGLGKFAIDGVAVVLVSNNLSSGSIGQSVWVETDGNLTLSATNDLRAEGIAGQLVGGANAGIGGTAVTQTITNRTLSGMERGVTADVSLRTLVQALAEEKVYALAAGGVGAGKVGIAGSATVNQLDVETRAYVAGNAILNGTLSPSGPLQSVWLQATDTTWITSAAGAVGGAGAVGIGAGADVGSIRKQTEAVADPTVINARGDIVMRALSSEDFTTIAASAAGGGSIGIAGAAAVYTMDIVTRTLVGDGTVLFAHGNIIVQADDKSEVDGIGGNITGAGSVSVGAAATVTTIAKETIARIGSNAQVTALGQFGDTLVPTGDFTVTFASNSGAYGEVAPPSVNTSAVSQALTQQRTAQLAQNSMRGLAVIANNRDDLETYTVSGGGSGAVAVNAGGSVHIMQALTRAVIDEQAIVNGINSSAHGAQSVRVAAGNDYYHTGITGILAGAGAVAVAPGADVTVVRNRTEAYLGAGATVGARGDLEVLARAHETILSLSAGIAGAGTVAVAGAVSPVRIDTTTLAYLGDFAVAHVTGNMVVSAHDDTETDVIAGAIGGAGAVGVGGSVGVTNITKNTRGFLGAGAFAQALGNSNSTFIVANTVDLFNNQQQARAILPTGVGMLIEAVTSEDLHSVVIAGAAGYYAGVAGAVTVDLVDSDTMAYVSPSARVNSGVVGANAQQSVTVSAANALRVIGTSGALGLGIAGISGGVDVGILKNDVQAFVGEDATVEAFGDVNVWANSAKTVDSRAISAAGGLVGVGGSVSVYGIGGNLDSDAHLSLTTQDQSPSENPLYPNVQSYADAQLLTSGMSGLLGTYQSTGGGNAIAIDQATTAASGQVATSLPIGAVSAAASSTVVSNGTVAFVANRGVVSAGDDVTIEANDQLTFDAKVGGLSAGLVGAGGSVAVANFKLNAHAFVAGTAAAVDDIRVASDLQEDLEGDAFAGQIGLVALGAQVVLIKDQSTSRADVTGGAFISRADEFTLEAKTHRVARAESVGGQLAGGALGASVATVHLDGSTTAEVGPFAVVARNKALSFVQTVHILADATNLARTRTSSVMAGIGLAGAGSVATTRVRPQVLATIGVGAVVNSVLDTNLRAISAVDADADANAIPASIGVGIGLSQGEVEVTPTVRASVEPQAGVSAGRNIQVDALENYDVADNALGYVSDASATAPGGGILLGFTGARAISNVSPTVESRDLAGSTLTAGGSLTMRGRTGALARADAGGIAIGALSVGLTKAEATSGGVLLVHSDGTLQVTGSVAISAFALQTAESESRAVSGGIVSGIGTWSEAIVIPIVRSDVGPLAAVNVGGALSIAARTEGGATSQAKGINGGVVAVGSSRSTSRVVPDVAAFVGAGTVANVGGNLVVEATHNFTTAGAFVTRRSQAVANSSTGGLIGINGSEAEATASAIVMAFLDSSTNVVVRGNVALNARAHDEAWSDASGNRFGILGLGESIARSNVRGNVSSSLRNNGRLEADGNAAMTAWYNQRGDGEVTAATGGIIAGSRNRLDTIVDTDVATLVAPGGWIQAGGHLSMDAAGWSAGNAAVRGMNLGAVAIGNSELSVIEDANVHAYIGNSARSQSGGNTTIRARHNTTESGAAMPSQRFDATTNATSGTLLGSKSDTEARFASTTSVLAFGDANATLISGNDLTFTAISSNAAKTAADGRSIALVAVTGKNFASADINATTRVFFGSGALVNAVHDVRMSALTVNDATSTSQGGSGAIGFSGASTDANARIVNLTEAAIGTATRVIAGNLIQLDATTFLDAHTNARIETAGIITFNRTESDTDVVNTTQVDIASNAYLKADCIRLYANVFRLDADANAYSKTFAAGSKTDAASYVDVFSNARVWIHGNATLIACQNIDIVACHSGVDTDSDALAAIGAGVTGIVVAEGHNTLAIHSDVQIDAGATLETNSLTILAKSPTDGSIYGHTAEADAQTVVNYIVQTVEKVKEVLQQIPLLGWILKKVLCWVTETVQQILYSDESATLTGTFTSANSIINNGTVIQCPPPAPTIVIDVLGNIMANNATARVVGNDIIVDNILNTQQNRVLFNAPNGTVAGNGKIKFAKAIDNVTIINHSPLNLRVGEIRTRAANTTLPDLEISAAHEEAIFELLPGSDHYDVVIDNRNSGDVVLTEDIENSVGTVSIFNAGGNIIGLPGKTVQAHDIRLDALQGDIGSDTNPLQLNLFSLGDETSADVSAHNNVNVLVGVTELITGQGGAPIKGDVNVAIHAGNRARLIAGTGVTYFPSAAAGNAPILAAAVGLYDLTEVDAAVLQLQETARGQIAIQVDLGQPVTAFHVGQLESVTPIAIEVAASRPLPTVGTRQIVVLSTQSDAVPPLEPASHLQRHLGSGVFLDSGFGGQGLRWENGQLLATVYQAERGDTNGDAALNAADIDALHAAQGSSDSHFDLNADGLTDADDVELLIRNILLTRPGDINLDGNVDASDAAIMFANWGQKSQSWSHGDLNFDGIVDAADASVMFAEWTKNVPAEADRRVQGSDQG